MKNSILKRRLSRFAGGVGTVFLLGGVFAGCSDDLLTGQPSWLGESIYAELESRGNFTETLKLINAQSEDYASVLKKTGSKTLLVADDDAWAEFYKNNPWGVKSIEEMTEAQKRLVFKANMIDQAYLVELMGNKPSASADDDPKEGAVLRRSNSVSIMDSVPIVLKAQFPVVNTARIDSKTGEQIDYWKRVRGKDKIVLLQDDNVAPMMHFLPKYMQLNNVNNDDVTFMTNGDITSTESAFVNGKVVKTRDITCQNGYIHELEGVALPLENMAQIIANQPQFSIYNRLLDRFSYPHYDAGQTEEYRRQTHTEDSVYVKRYFNNHAKNTFNATDADDGKVSVTTLLPYDPGWNLYTLEGSSGVTFQEAAAVMLVPTDEAMMDYLSNQGRDLQDRYGDAGAGPTAWDNAPDEVVLPLLKNTMLTSLTSALPSGFANINNTASEPMGVVKEDVDQTIWGCNGVVYQTNVVYVAPEYVSVYYPCVIRANDDLKIMYTAVTNDADKNTVGAQGFHAYLNNMGSKYSFIIPTDNAMQNYYDPVSRYRIDSKNSSTAIMYKFYINDAGFIAAYPYKVDWSVLDEKGRGQVAEEQTSEIGIGTSNASNGDAFNHFADIVNSSLCVSLFKPGQKFYLSKNGNPIIVQWNGNKVTGVAGSFQYERNYFVPVIESFDKSTDGNGMSYIIDEEPLMSTFTSPMAALKSEENAAYFSEFYTLLSSMGNIRTDDGYEHVTQDQAITSMNNYHYTMYVPTNESIQALKAGVKGADGKESLLPSWDDIDLIDNAISQAKLLEEDEEIAADMKWLEEQKAAIDTIISNFVNYHIQDNSVFVEGEEYSSRPFESFCLDLQTNRYVKLSVSYTQGGKLTVTDRLGNVRTVSSDPAVHNILTRQYYFNNKELKYPGATQIYSSSYCVIHQIDGPLYSSANCFYPRETYDKVKAIVAKYYTEPEEGEEGEGGEGGTTPNPVKRHKR